MAGSSQRKKEAKKSALGKKDKYDMISIYMWNLNMKEMNLFYKTRNRLLDMKNKLQSYQRDTRVIKVGSFRYIHTTICKQTTRTYCI